MRTMKDKHSIIADFKRLRTNYEEQVLPAIIEKCNYLVEVGALTVGTELNVRITAQNVLYPAQFSESGITKILNLNWHNSQGENIKPIIFPKNKWYRERINMLNETLNSWMDY